MDADQALPRIVFCTTCKGRTFHLERTLPRNIADNADYPNCKFVVLDYNSIDNLHDYVYTNHDDDLKSGKVALYIYRERDEPFRMAHAKNMAHRCGLLEGAEILCNLDADNFTGPGFARYIAARFMEDPERFLWADRNQPAPVRYPKGCNGRIVVSADAFLKSGGYNEAKYNTWGPDDKDFNMRLRRFGYVACQIERKYLEVILHNDKMRFKEYPDLRKELDELDDWYEFQAVDETTTIANWGVFGCGTVFKNDLGSGPIELASVPTRIFGIGMHKTGTTSLHAAFKILGFDSAHWKSVRWAKHIWVEMKEACRSLTLERHYALADLPIPLLYRELDKAYPGSKFILTVRDENKWLRSVRNHWGKWNNFRGTWKKEESFPQQIHKEVYGQTDFDEAVFRERYRRHNTEVQEYFKGRPNDLLVMNVEKSSKENWKALCGFLNKPVPNALYPIEFSSATTPSQTPSPDSQEEPFNPAMNSDTYQIGTPRRRVEVSEVLLYQILCVILLVALVIVLLLKY